VDLEEPLPSKASRRFQNVFPGCPAISTERKITSPEHDRQFSAILEKQEEHDEKFRDIFGHFDQLYQRLTLLEDEYHAIVHSLRRIETLMETEQENREILERRLEELKSQVDNLQLRIVELEERLRQ